VKNVLSKAPNQQKRIMALHYPERSLGQGQIDLLKLLKKENGGTKRDEGAAIKRTKGEVCTEAGKKATILNLEKGGGETGEKRGNICNVKSLAVF